MVLASGYLSEYLEDKGTKSIFSGVGISERPDTVCGKLMEGRVAILVDGTPTAIIIPHILWRNFRVWTIIQTDRIMQPLSEY